jgi:hypothetical protein
MIERKEGKIREKKRSSRKREISDGDERYLLSVEEGIKGPRSLSLRDEWEKHEREEASSKKEKRQKDPASTRKTSEGADVQTHGSLYRLTGKEGKRPDGCLATGSEYAANRTRAFSSREDRPQSGQDSRLDLQW